MKGVSFRLSNSVFFLVRSFRLIISTVVVFAFILPNLIAFDFSLFTDITHTPEEEVFLLRPLCDISVPVPAELSCSSPTVMTVRNDKYCGTYETTKTQERQFSVFGGNPPLSSPQLACNIDCSADLKLYLRDGQCDFTYNSDPPGLIDCNLINYTLKYELYYPANGGSMVSSGEGGISNAFEPGLTEVVYTLLDENEDVMDICSFRIEVVDSFIPQLLCSDTLSYLVNGENDCDLFVDLADFLPIINDNCVAEDVIQLIVEELNGSSSSFILNPNFLGYRFRIGESDLKFIVSDPVGNLDSCQFKVQVKDETAPKILSCPNPQEVRTNTGSCEAVVTIPFLPMEVDLCDNSAIQTYSISPINMVGSPPSTVRLPVGDYTISYEVTDFSGNRDICSYVLNVRDRGIPQIIECPQDQVSYLDEGCSKTDTIKLPSELFDDCMEEVFILDSIMQFMTFDSDDKVESMKFTFDRSDLHAFSSMRLQFFIWGDVDDDLESFSILGENGGVSNTATRLGADCETYSLTTLNLQVSELKEWIKDGKIEFELTPNQLGSGPSSGGDPDTYAINNYCPNGSSGTPRILAILSYPKISNFHYQVTNGGTTSGLQPISLNAPNLFDFEQGSNQVELIFADQGGNQVSCSYEYLLVDSIQPTITCETDPISYELQADGTEQLLLIPSMFDFKISDNCRLIDTVLIPNVLNCSNVQDDPLTLQLSVQDQNGNTAQCEVFIELSIENIFPTYNAGLCEGDTLRLFMDANISVSSGTYEFQWYHPDGQLLSEDENPVLTDVDASDSGVYELRILSNQSSCISVGLVDVRINAIPDMPVVSSNRQGYCFGEEITLETAPIAGASSYRWFLDDGNGLQLINTTSRPEYKFTPSGLGRITCAVDVEVGDCSSAMSSALELEVFVAPGLDLTQDQLIFCEEDTITLFSGQQFSEYEWKGVNNFESTDPNPIVSESADFTDAGWYYLRVKQGACYSEYDSVEVIIKEKPETPSILFKEIICPGEDLVLSSNIGNGDQFFWELPDASVLNSTVNTIVIPASDLIEGQYSVALSFEGCISDYSPSKELTIQEELDLNVQTNSPICRGDEFTLSADEFEGMRYEWIGPGFSFPDRETTVNNPVSGKYVLTGITDQNCIFYDSIELVINDRPELIAINSNLPNGSCLNGRDSLVLSPQLGLISGSISYHWTDPKGQSFTSENLTLLNADTSVNGEYRLMVTSSEGCQSAEVSIVLNFISAPTAPVIVFSDPVCEGEELIVSSSVRMGANVVYEWNTPVGSRTSLGPDLIFSNANIGDHRGWYSVRLSIGDCKSAYSDSVFIEVFRKPDTPRIYGNDSYCSGDTLYLSTDLLSDVNYFWQYPGNTSDTNFVLIPTANPSNSGEYILQIENDLGCKSEIQSTEISIENRPEKPIVISNSPVCPGQEIILQVNTNFSDSILWVGPSGQVLSSRSNTITLNASDASKGEWRARAFLGSCGSIWSDPEEVEVDQNYSISISSNTPLCESDTLRLNASFIEGSSYLWSNGDGIEIADVRELTVVQPEEEWITLLWTSPLGCEIIDSVEIVINANPKIDSIRLNGNQCVNGTSTIELIPVLDSSSGVDYNFTWLGPRVNGVDSILVIENVEIEDSGDYIVEVINEKGCSTGKINYDLELTDIPPIPDIRQNFATCEGDTIRLFTDIYNDPTANYEWTFVGGVDITRVPEFKISTEDYVEGSPIQLRIFTDQCTSSSSLNFYPTINPVPDPPTIDYPSSICEGDTLILTAEFRPGASYVWEGPMGFSSSLQEPKLPDAREMNEGFYRVRIIVDGCSSVFTDSVLVEVRANPPAPKILSVTSPCIDQGDQFITIEMDTSDGMRIDQYHIYDRKDNRLIGAYNEDTGIELPVDSFELGANSIYVQSENAGCFSSRSMVSNFNVFTIPDTFVADAGIDLILCAENELLRANRLPDDSNYSGIWRQVGGGNAVGLLDPTKPTAEVFFNDLQGGEEYIFEWSVSYGTCENYSRDSMTIYRVNTGQLAQVEPIIEVCNQDSLYLSAQPPTGLVEGYWRQSYFQENTLGVEIVDSLNPNTLIRGLVPEIENEYTFTWQLTHPECPNFNSATTRVIVQVKDNCEAFAGLDQEICGEPIAQLNAGSSGACTGVWTTLGNANLADPLNADSEAHDLEVGDNYFVYTVSDLQCGIFDRDTSIVRYYLGVEAKDDEYQMDFAGFDQIDILENDFGVENSMIEILTDPVNGRLELTDTEISYYTDIGYIGEDQFSYQICDLRCENYCDTASVTIVVGDNLDCTIPTLITPNNDEVNDVFIIPCLASQNYPNNSVTIFNQWGDEVFNASPYLNDWRGEYKGEDLGDGTYFYLVNFGTGIPTESGFLIIQR